MVPVQGLECKKSVLQAVGSNVTGNKKIFWFISLFWILLGEPLRGHTPSQDVRNRLSKEPHNHCHFRYKIKVKTLLEAQIFLHSRPYTGTIKASDVMNQVFSIKCQLKQFCIGVPESKIQL